MGGQVKSKTPSPEQVLLGDEAVAVGAIDAGITAAYAYPGTPSTELVEYLLQYQARHGGPQAAWSVNEKVAYEEALGVSMAGRRALVAMKHVGLNVAADPFMSSALITIHGGLVLVVADDPGMHSSQNEQDSRYYADFAHILCLEPANQQQAYEMTREAFDLSERFHIPVMIRLVTRLAHSRSVVRRSEPRGENELEKIPDPAEWILLPSFARPLWHKLQMMQKEMRAYTESAPHNVQYLNPLNRELGVITTGVARNYYTENLRDLGFEISHLHVGAYPLPVGKIRNLASRVDKILVLEEGYPYLERYLRGILPAPVEILGKVSGEIPAEGELNPDVVRKALGLPEREQLPMPDLELPVRPALLCPGCPHRDVFPALIEALSEFDNPLVPADVGCNTFGALPPYSALDSCICMGASVGTAKGAADAGYYPVVGVIGDSTFLHSGVPPLMDAIRTDADMTLLILDNEAVAMTGAQPTILASSKIAALIRGMGVDPEHFHSIEVHPRKTGELAELIRREVKHHGLSVIIALRECIESVRKKKKKQRAEDRQLQQSAEERP
ncbi:MAG: indolepyruvate ferredoxin oxidoreductase [bacterium]|nr:indolepyruvate ferredoxin oxidoreductase [bacterium]